VGASAGESSHERHLRLQHRYFDRERACVAESDEDKPGVILDYEEQGDLVSLELLDASRRVTDVREVEYEIAA
jgi:hypothetical protein